MGETLRSVLSDDNIPWDKLKECTILVTGTTGLIGGIVARVLAAANESRGLGMRLIAHGRNKDKGETLARELSAEFISGDIRHMATVSDIYDKLDYMIHCAAITKSADMVAKPVDVIATTVDGTKNMLELAKEKHCRGFVFLSSMEIYGQTGPRELSESDLGSLDLSNPRSSYPESKRLCELMCVAYAAEHGLPTKIARLARTFGAGTPNDESDMRVANQFARKALASEDIELHTPGNSIANCCYMSDTIRGLLVILLKGENGQAYNIANPEASMTIREMAEMVAGNYEINVTVKIPDDLKKLGYAPDIGYTLNADKLTALGWKPRYGLEEMYKRMIEDWQGKL
jgi:nucleoside-diphosphate-sugar epimerase